MVRISNRVLRNFLFNDPSWVLEKTGWSHDLFRKKGTNEIAFKYQILERERPDDKMRYCVFIRQLGRCHEALECKKECAYNDLTILSVLKIKDPNCLKFVQVCNNPKSACSNCKDYCELYKNEIVLINQKLGTDYSYGVNCR